MAVRKTSAIALTGITLAATSTFALAQQKPDGLYSADQLLDAEVYAQGDAGVQCRSRHRDCEQCCRDTHSTNADPCACFAHG